MWNWFCNLLNQSGIGIRKQGLKKRLPDLKLKIDFANWDTLVLLHRTNESRRELGRLLIIDLTSVLLSGVAYLSIRTTPLWRQHSSKSTFRTSWSRRCKFRGKPNYIKSSVVIILTLASVESAITEQSPLLDKKPDQAQQKVDTVLLISLYISAKQMKVRFHQYYPMF